MALSLITTIFLFTLGSNVGSNFISRTNYSVFFKEEGFIISGGNLWLHSFRITLPQLSLPYIDSLQCSNSATQLLHNDCHIRNVIIRGTNEIISGLNQKVKEISKMATKSLTSKFMMNKPEKVKGTSKTKLKRDLLFSFIVNITNINQSVANSHSRRGLLDFVGDIANSLFNIATDKEKENLQNYMKLLDGQQRLTNTQLQELSSLMNTFMAKLTTCKRIPGITQI